MGTPSASLAYRHSFGELKFPSSQTTLPRVAPLNKRDSFLDYHLLWQKFSSLTALRALEPAIALFSFDNIVFPQPARHNLQLCYARPIAADVVEPSVADLGFQLSDFTFQFIKSLNSSSSFSLTPRAMSTSLSRTIWSATLSLLPAISLALLYSSTAVALLWFTHSTCAALR